MLKKSAILGLLLLLAGTAVLKWILTEKRKEQQQLASYKLKYSSETDEYIKQYNEWLQLAPEEQALSSWILNKSGKTKTEAQLQQEQRGRLKADLDKLAASETQVYPFADVLYGENWQKEFSNYKRQKELRESVFTGSIMCTFTGGAIFGWCLLVWMARLLIRVLSRLRSLQTFIAVFNRPLIKLLADVLKITDKKLTKDNAKKSGKNSEQGQKPHKIKSQIEKHSAALINSGWQNLAFIRSETNLGENETASPISGKSCSNNRDLKCEKKLWGVRSPKNAEKIAVGSRKAGSLLLSEPASAKRFAESSEKSTESEQFLRAARENLILKTMQPDSPQSAEKATSSDSLENTVKLEDSLKAQAENLEKQMEEFKQMTQRVQQTTFEHSKPLNNAIKELTEQVSAIREYAAYQQDRVEKLQDGYDWNIIRTFCLRVIRCIDNLESRISQLSEEGIETTNLEEARDELLFALESSGIEQFEPEVNSDYRGQEKFAEAVKDKQHCDNPKQTGKIAKVIRPGYQYFINEDNIKVVRTAQVKLFG